MIGTKQPSAAVGQVMPNWRHVQWNTQTKTLEVVRHGTACIFHILPSDQYLFFRRSADKPGLPFPGRVCLIGGGKKVTDKTPLAALRREVASELVDRATGLPVRLGHVAHVARLYDSRPGVIDVYAYEFNYVPDFVINEGDGLVILSRQQVLKLDLPYGFTDVVREYVTKHQMAVKGPSRS